MRFTRHSGCLFALRKALPSSSPALASSASTSLSVSVLCIDLQEHCDTARDRHRPLVSDGSSSRTSSSTASAGSAMHNSSLLGNPLKQLWSAYERQLERRPVLTQMTTSALLWCSGDLIAQRLEHWEQQREAAAAAEAAAARSSSSKAKRAAPGPHPSSAEVGSPAADGDAGPCYDWRRAVMTGMFGATLVGPVGHFWYMAIDKWCKRLVPGGGPAFIGAKVLLDTAAMGPFYVAAFFAWGCALIDGSGMSEFKRKMSVDFVPTLAAEVTLWPVIQAINFSCVPLKHQLLVVNTMTIFDACFMSWARNQEDWLGKARRWVGMAEEQEQGGAGGSSGRKQLQAAPLKAGKSK